MAKINDDIIDVKKLRITKLREYLFEIIDTLLTDKKYQINVNMLSDNVNNYSLDKIPRNSTVEEWITGERLCTDVFSFRSRVGYSQDAMENLLNMGFFEIFESIIGSNNKKGILPDIEGIQSIKCLNCGSMTDANTKNAEINIQIQIIYRE